MKSHGPKHHLEAVVHRYAATLGVRHLTSVSSQASHYIFQADTSYVIKATMTKDPAAELRKTLRQAKLLRKLRENGAMVKELVVDPVEQEGIIMVVSYYYPYELPAAAEGYAFFGSALASLHNAGRGMSDGKLLNPLAVIWQLFDYLLFCQQNENPFSIGETVFPKDTLGIFEERLTKAQIAYDEMMRLTIQRGSATMLLMDVNPYNIRLDAKNQPRLIDLLGNLTLGPPEYDLARPSAHWVQRIGRDKRLVAAFMDAYYKKVRGHTIDDYILQLAITVADVYYASSMLKNTVNAYRQGQRNLKEWQLIEAVRRIRNLDDPYFQWKTARDYE